MLRSSPVLSNRRLIGFNVLEYTFSNSIPPPEHEHEIRELITQKFKEITHIQNEKSILLERIERLDRSQQTFSNELAKYRGTVSALKKLPPNVLARVFFHVTLLSDSNSRIKTSLTLSHVSRRWRDAALSLPELWTTLFINVTSFKDQSHPLVKQFLERSKTAPLSLTLTINPTRTGNPCYHLIRDVIFSLLKETLNPVFHRVRSLTFKCQIDLGTQLDSETPIQIDVLSAPSAPILETLHLLVNPHMYPFLTTWMRTLITNAPRLRHLSCRFPIMVLKNVAWCNVESLNLLEASSVWRFSSQEIASILSAAPLLRECTVELRRCEATNTSLTPFLHNALRILSVRENTDGRLGDLLDKLTCPKLTSLLIYRDGIRFRDWPDLSIRSFLERSRCNLKRLRLPNISIPANLLKSLLAMDAVRNSLEDLTLQKISSIANFVIEDILKYLTISSETVHLLPLPNLRSITCAIEAISHSHLFRLFVDSRFGPGRSRQVASLQRICLTISSPQYTSGAVVETPDLMAYLADIGREIDVRVTSHRTLVAIMNPDQSSSFPPPSSSPFARDVEDVAVVESSGNEYEDLTPQTLSPSGLEGEQGNFELIYPDELEQLDIERTLPPETSLIDSKANSFNSPLVPDHDPTQARTSAPNNDVSSEQPPPPPPQPPIDVEDTTTSPITPRSKRRRIISEKAKMASLSCAAKGCADILTGSSTTLTCSASGCDNRYHLGCQGMTTRPVGKWFCDSVCRLRSSAIRTKRSSPRKRPRASN
ncbi:hypothetical protein E1B28_008511 [Marasmius oreades]|uniref:F-box domain-containing protein n=1 Tax=Marasmius oreades TaxID=181124 RepID=A0A9P7RZ84_9AGAR|nr:uncharacterized protein E1B28_008511 [Marasmius oreades]KAG7092137.1 hypothetical protein E1B28_008511 [Marasmius oreades]